MGPRAAGGGSGDAGGCTTAINHLQLHANDGANYLSILKI